MLYIFSASLWHSLSAGLFPGAQMYTQTHTGRHTRIYTRCIHTHTRPERHTPGADTPARCSETLIQHSGNARLSFHTVRTRCALLSPWLCDTRPSSQTENQLTGAPGTHGFSPSAPRPPQRLQAVPPECVWKRSSSLSQRHPSGRDHRRPRLDNRDRSRADDPPPPCPSVSAPPPVGRPPHALPFVRNILSSPSSRLRTSSLILHAVGAAEETFRGLLCCFGPGSPFSSPSPSHKAYHS